MTKEKKIMNSSELSKLHNNKITSITFEEYKILSASVEKEIDQQYEYENNREEQFFSKLVTK